MKNNLLIIINSRRTVRKYDWNKKVTDKDIRRLLNSARFCQSAHNMQPWKFVVLRDKIKINEIAKAMEKKSKKMHIGFNILMKDASNTVRNAPVIITVHNTGSISKKFSNLGGSYKKLCGIYEVQSIAAAIQNISITANVCRLGLAWIGIALFCSKEIKNILAENDSLMALLTIGHPCEISKSTTRKTVEEIAVFK